MYAQSDGCKAEFKNTTHYLWISEQYEITDWKTAWQRFNEALADTRRSSGLRQFLRPDEPKNGSSQPCRVRHTRAWNGALTSVGQPPDV